MFRWLVSAGFFALPIGATIGILLAVQGYRSANGQPPPFSGGDAGSGLPGISTPKDSVQTWCDEAFGFDPKSKGVDFILNPNPWGWKKGEAGALCMLVNFNGNRTYETPYSAPPFNVTWIYPKAQSDVNNVHAFPNAKIDSKNFPYQLDSITDLNFDVDWHLSLKNDTLDEVKKGDASAQTINANVAIDMFIDADGSKAADSEKASHEVMVWFAEFGTDAWPLGKTQGGDQGVKATKTLGDATFQLFTGQNSKGQTVLSWTSSDPVNTFNGSLMPLFDEIYALNDASYPKKSYYLGYFAFGQEAYWSPQNVTFAVPRLAVDIQTS